MPKYKLVDFNNNFSWIRYPDGSYLVDKGHEEEFILFYETKNNEPL